jgi:transposase
MWKEGEQVTRLFVGIDWGSRTHAVCVVDAEGKVVLETEVEHRGEAVLGFVDRLLERVDGDPKQVMAAMEAPHGVMIEALFERGVPTYYLNPKQLDRFRDRHSGAGAKDDDLDALVLAKSLRTDQELFRKVVLPTERQLELRELSRGYQALTDTVLATASQIRELLRRYYPAMADLDDWHEKPWLYDLFEAAPTPAKAKRLQQATVKRILKKYRLRRSHLEVLVALRETPLPVAKGVPEAFARRISMLLPVLRAAHEQRSHAHRELKDFFRRAAREADAGTREADSPENEHHDTALLLSLPGIGVRNGAVMLSEAPVALQTRDYNGLRRLAGVAPVSQRTGGRSKAPHVLQRRACNGRLRDAVFQWGNVAMQHDPHTRQHYAELRARGKTHGRAIRGVVDRLLKVLVAVLKSGVPYDPSLRQQSGDENRRLAA